MKTITFLIVTLALSTANINSINAQTMSQQTTLENEFDVQQATAANKTSIQKGNKLNPWTLVYEDRTIHTHLSLSNTIGDLSNHTAFRGFGEMLLPRENNSSYYSTSLKNVVSEEECKALAGK